MMKIEALTIADNELFLRQVSKEVDPKDPQLKEHIQALEMYCKQHEVMARASVQIGIPKRLIYLKNTNLEMVRRLQTIS